MTYTVGQMAKMLGLAGSTLRYYDKEGLLPFVERSSGGIRMFREKDYEWLQIIECLKKAGMSIKDIKKIHCPSATGRFHNSGTFRVIPAPAHRPAGADGFPATDT